MLLFCNTIFISLSVYSLSLAYSHAKLALRTEVTLLDALMAIRFYEEYLTARFGKEPPPPQKL